MGIQLYVYRLHIMMQMIFSTIVNTDYSQGELQSTPKNCKERLCPRCERSLSWESWC